MFRKLKKSHLCQILKIVLVTPFQQGNSKSLMLIHFTCAIFDFNGLSILREWILPGQKAVLSIFS
jgi:hypothetical protein